MNVINTEVSYSYEAALAAAQRVAWRIEDIIGPDKSLDFTKRFLPETFARVEALPFLDTNEKRVLNQIRGHGYLYTFGLVEEFILPLVMDHARPSLAEDDTRTRAYLQFAAEEAKHIDLFKRFRQDFEDGFGQTCGVIGPAQDIANHVLSFNTLSVALLTLHIEWFTQKHYVESIRDDSALDPQFKSLLKYHWLEEAQHAKLDTLMILEMVRDMTAEEIEAGISGYLEIGGFLDGGMKSQAELDLQSFENAVGRTLDDDQRQTFLDVQHQALRWTFIGSGMAHEKVQDTFEMIQPGAKARLAAIAPGFC